MVVYELVTTILRLYHGYLPSRAGAQSPKYTHAKVLNLVYSDLHNYTVVPYLVNDSAIDETATLAPIITSS